MNRIYQVLCVLVFTGAGLKAQGPVLSADTQSIVFELGEVEIVGEKNNPLSLVVNSETLAGNPKRDVSQALISLSGLNFVYLGQKNDAMVSVRGFDLRQVPVYLDGVPVYVSYDGYADLGRFLVSDLSEISVSRGEASLLLGPNALGGAINLVSRKPASKLELDAASGIIFDRRGYGGLHSELNVGSRKEKYYFQAGIAFVESKPYVLSGKGDQGNGQGMIQFNSHQRDLNSSIKAGFTPNATDSYVFSYHFQDGLKGVPVYNGEDPAQRARYWQIPTIQKQGLHFNSKTSLGKESYIQTRLYYDDYLSDLRSYDDSSFTTQERRSSFTSIYDDETLGGSILVSMQPAARQRVRTALHTLYDHHRENNIYPTEEPVRHFRDLTYSLGLEDQISVTERLQLTAGISVNLKTNLQADNYDALADSVFPFPQHDDRAFNLLVGGNYELGQSHHLSTHLSRKNRFPTMKDRYSYRLGQSLPNPDLMSEASWNFDLGYAFVPGTFFQVKTSLFYSHLTDAIQAVYGVDPDNSAVYQFQNTGNARFYGWEADLLWNPFSMLKMALQYTLTERQNISNPDLLFTDVPKHKVHGTLQFRFFSDLIFNLSGMYNSPRTSNSNGQYGTEYFITLDFKAAYTILSALTIEASVSNLMDADYSYLEGYPAPGRQFHLGFRYRLQSRDF